MKLYKLKKGFTEPPIEEEKQFEYIGSDFIASFVDIPGLTTVKKGSTGWKAAAAFVTENWRYQSGDDLKDRIYTVLDQVGFVQRVRDEVGRRILDHASTGTQMNMAAAAAAGLFTEDELNAFKEGLMWVAAVRAKGAELAQSGVVDYANDEHWPEPTDAAQALADRF